MNFFKNKKGQGNVYIAVPLFLMTYGLLFIICYLVLYNFVSVLSTTPYYDAQMNEASQKFLGALQLLDFVMVFMTIVLIVSIGITSYRLATPSIFFIINLVAGAFYGFIAYFFSYIFTQFVSNPMLSAVLLYFPRTILLCTNLHWVALVCLIVGSITLFGKKARGQYVE